MTTIDEPRHLSPAPMEPLASRPSPLGRLSVWGHRPRPLTSVVWLLVIVGLGAFAPRVETEPYRAGWQADGSESVSARELAQERFGVNASTAIQVVVHSTEGPVTEGAGKQVLAEPRRSSTRTRASPTSWSRSRARP